FCENRNVQKISRVWNVNDLRKNSHSRPVAPEKPISQLKSGAWLVALVSMVTVFSRYTYCARAEMSEKKTTPEKISQNRRIFPRFKWRFAAKTPMSAPNSRHAPPIYAIFTKVGLLHE